MRGIPPLFCFFLLLSGGCSQWELEPKNARTLLVPDLIQVPGGTFRMGSLEGFTDELPIHTVTVSGFSMGKYEITVKQYRDFCTATNRAFPQNPFWAWADDHPIVFVSWHDATAYCAWLSSQTGKRFRLPTEAEWEYAAKGGSPSQPFKYAGSDNPDEVGWYGGNTGIITAITRPVGQKKPNTLGLHDMSGNAWEWCSDWYGPYPATPLTDPTGPTTGSMRAMRGGSWFDFVIFLRAARRYPLDGDGSYEQVGFRIVQEN